MEDDMKKVMLFKVSRVCGALCWTVLSWHVWLHCHGTSGVHYDCFNVKFTDFVGKIGHGLCEAHGESTMGQGWELGEEFAAQAIRKLPVSPRLISTCYRRGVWNEIPGGSTIPEVIMEVEL